MYDEDEDNEMSLTKEEQAAIASLKRLAKKWPKSLWLYSASGSLTVMKKGADGEAIMRASGGADQSAAVATIDIDNDGGDW